MSGPTSVSTCSLPAWTSTGMSTSCILQRWLKKLSPSGSASTRIGICLNSFGKRGCMSLPGCHSHTLRFALRFDVKSRAKTGVSVTQISKKRNRLMRSILRECFMIRMLFIFELLGFFGVRQRLQKSTHAKHSSRNKTAQANFPHALLLKKKCVADNEKE